MKALCDLSQGGNVVTGCMPRDQSSRERQAAAARRRQHLLARHIELRAHGVDDAVEQSWVALTTTARSKTREKFRVLRSAGGIAFLSRTSR